VNPQDVEQPESESRDVEQPESESREQGPSSPPSVGREAEAFESRLRHRQPITWWLTLVGPVGLTLALLGLLAALHGTAYVQRMIATAFATFFFFGRFVILGGDDPEIAELRQFFSGVELSALVIYMDLMTAVVLVFHMAVLFRLPFVGHRMRGLVDDGRFIVGANPWMRRATFFGMVAFVMFPLAATGSVGGAIFGRLLGMTRRATLFAIGLGSLLGCAVMYSGASILRGVLDRDNPAVVVGGVAVIALVVLALNLRYRALKARAALLQDDTNPQPRRRDQA
jgi:uncharacterized membrane protein